MGGGGATSQEPVGFPAFFQQQMMGLNMFDVDTGSWLPANDQEVYSGGLLAELSVTTGAFQADPPTNVFAEAVNAPKDPSTRILKVEQSALDFETESDRLDAEVDWSSAFDKAVEKDSSFTPLDPNLDIHTATTGILAKALTRVGEMNTSLLSNADTSTDTQIDTIITKSSSISTTIMDNAIVEALSVLQQQPTRQAVEAFEDRARRRLSRKFSRFRGQMALVNAVNTSGFILGNASLENELDRSVVDYDAQVSLTLYNQVVNVYAEVHRLMSGVYQSLLQYLDGRQVESYKQIFISELRSLWQAKMVNEDAKFTHYRQAVQTMTSALMQGVTLKGHSAQVEIEGEKLAIIAEKEYQEDLLNVAHMRVDFRLDRAQKGANIVASGFGGTMTSSAPLSKSQSALGGAFAGAAIGTQIAPGIGTAIGVGIGGLAGLLSGGN